MTHVIVYTQEDQKKLLDANTNNIQLEQQPSVVQLALGREEIESMTRDGNKLVIVLKNGEKIVIEDYFADEHELVLSRKSTEYYQVNFDSEGQFQSYKDLYYSANTAQPQQIAEVATEAETGSFWSEHASLIKIGLGVLAAEALYLTVFDNDDDDKNSGPKDVVAPMLASANLDDEGMNISGLTEANANVYVVDGAGKILSSTKADKDGNYTLKLDTALTDLKSLTVYAKDAAGNTSNKLTVIGQKDTIAPDAPAAQANAEGTIISGTAEVKSTIVIKDIDGNILGTGVASEGSYTINLSRPLKEGEIVNVTAQDSSGNISSESHAQIGKDTMPPTKPSLQVERDGTKVVGKAEPNATVQVLDSDGKVIVTGKVDANGLFSLDLPVALTGSLTNQVVIIDAAGNKSSVVIIEADTDLLAPDAPTNLKINDKGTIISGTAEPNSTVKIIVGTTQIGTATVDADGKFSITVSKAVTDGNNALVTATDKAGNTSEAGSIKGTFDTIAPTKPNLPTLTDDVGATTGTISNGGTTDDAKPTFSGSGAEAGAILYIHENGVVIGSVKVETDRTWKWTPEKEFSLGEHELTFTLTDAANNNSAESESFKFTVEAPFEEEAETPVAKSMFFLDSESDALLKGLLDHQNTDMQNTATEDTDIKLNVNDLLQSLTATENVTDEILQNNNIESSNDTNSIATTQNTLVADIVTFEQFNVDLLSQVYVDPI